MLSGPLRDRFHMHEHLEFYDVDDLARIIAVNAAKLRTTITDEAAWELARRSRGTPRLANARLRWVRDFATARADGQINLTIANDALAMQDIDVDGMDRQDRRYLETLIQVFRGGPTGSEALAATMSIDVDTIKDEVEPYLLRKQLVVLTLEVARPLTWRIAISAWPNPSPRRISACSISVACSIERGPASKHLRNQM